MIVSVFSLLTILCCPRNIVEFPTVPRGKHTRSRTQPVARVRARWMPDFARWMLGRALWMPGSSRWMQGSTHWCRASRAGFRAERAGCRSASTVAARAGCRATRAWCRTNLAALTREHRRVFGCHGRGHRRTMRDITARWLMAAQLLLRRCALAVLLLACGNHFYENPAGPGETKHCRQYCTTLKTLYVKKKALWKKFET